MPRFVEVSHAIEPGMRTYPGLPEPWAEVLLDYDASRSRYAGAEFSIASLHLCGNTGTYVDSPRHRYPEKPAPGGVAEKLAHLPVEVIDVRGSPSRGAAMKLLLGEAWRGRPRRS